MARIVVDNSEFAFEHSAVQVRLAPGRRDDGLYIQVFVGGFGPVSEPPWPPLELDTLGPYPTLKAAIVAGEKYARGWIETFGCWRPPQEI